MGAYKRFIKAEKVGQEESENNHVLQPARGKENTHVSAGFLHLPCVFGILFKVSHENHCRMNHLGMTKRREGGFFDQLDRERVRDGANVVKANQSSLLKVVRTIDHEL